MLAAFLIVFRESFEAILVLGIVLAFLSKNGHSSLKKQVYFGTALALAVTAVSALLAGRLISTLSGTNLFLFEGISMIVAAAFITFVGFWALTENFRQEKRLVEKDLAARLSKKQGFGLASLAFVTVAREGIETVFLVGVISHGGSLLGISIGAAIGLASAFLIVKEALKRSLKLNRKRFFSAISVLLLLFASGLVSHSIRELHLAGALPFLKERAFDLSWLLPNNTILADILSTLFGYNATPSVLEVLGCIFYLLMIASVYLLLLKKIYKKPIKKSPSPGFGQAPCPA